MAISNYYDYLTITTPGSSPVTTIYSFVYPAESGTTVAGSTAINNLAIDSCIPFVRGGIPELRFHRVVGALAALPDPFDACTVSWSNYAGTAPNHSSATLYFAGTVVGYTDRFDGDVGWVRDYRALGLRNLGDYIPMTDSNTLTDNARFNMPTNTIATIPSRLGQTVGQAVLTVLTMPQNQAALSAAGIGAYVPGSIGTATIAAGWNGGTTLSTYGTISLPASGLTLGSGFSSVTPPSVTIVGPYASTGSQASFTPIISGGQITGFNVVSAGAGYASPPTVVISTLPSVTVGDLVGTGTGQLGNPNIAVISPFTLAFCGERLLSSIESIIQTCHPNHWLYVMANGVIRILDQRATSNLLVTLGNRTQNPSPPPTYILSATLGSNLVSADYVEPSDQPDGVTYGDRWLMPQLHRDSSDTYSQLIVRGGLAVSGVYLSVLPQQSGAWQNITFTPPGDSPVATGGLYPDFVWSGNSHMASATGWSPSSFNQLSLQGGQDQGLITSIADVSDFNIQSSNTSLTIPASGGSGALDQSSTGLHAIVTVYSTVISGVNQMFSTSVIHNSSITAGAGTLTVSPPLPSALAPGSGGYTNYFITFSSQAGNVVYRRYAVVDSSGWGPTSSMGPRLQQYFPYPFAYKNASGTAAALTSAPVGSVLWSSSGSAPFNESDFSVTVDPSSGTITFPTPTSLVYGGGVVTPPSNITVFVPVANGSLYRQSPTSGYAGTLYTVDGVQRTKYITIRDWTLDSGSNSYMQIFANEQFDSIKDVVVEGSISYLGLATPYLAPGVSISITGPAYTNSSGVAAVHTTGWETLQTSPMPPGLPVSQAQVLFKWNNSGTFYVTTLSLSNRKQRYSSEVFVRPAERGQMLGGQPFGAGYSAGWAGAAGALQNFGRASMGAMTPGDGPPGDLSAAEGGSHGFRGVTIDDTNRQLQRQRHDERIEQQHLAAQRARESRQPLVGPPAPESFEDYVHRTVQPPGGPEPDLPPPLPTPASPE
ncbi:MAG: hypothetical protein ACLQUY_20065 [Ktedonobacterales bacterium]